MSIDPADPPPTTSLRTPAADDPGDRIGPYHLLELIGQGGMGEVWAAQQTEPVRRQVAVKLIKTGLDSRNVLARFEVERQALALMDHPNIARVLDAGTADSGRPYFVMEMVRGVPITKFCDERRLSPHERLELFVPVCQAIQHAHQKGIIHRDLKPSNVLVALSDGRPVPKVIDFGVAKATGPHLTEEAPLTAYGVVVGTAEYMSPEQASLDQVDVDTRSDVYALGVLLYELLTGFTPIDRKSLGKAAILEVLRMVREVEPPRPSTKLSSSDALPSVAANRGVEPARLTRLMRGELDWIVMKALEKDRSRRYDTANGLARDIQRFLADEVIEARPPSAGYRVRKFVRRNRGQVLAAGLVLLALIAGFAGTAAGLVEARRQERQALEERDQKEQARLAEMEQKHLAEANERRAAAERDRAMAAEKEARDQAAVSRAVRDFLQNDLLRQADARQQAVTLRPTGAEAGVTPDPTIRELLDRAARGLSPGAIEAKFPGKPLVQAEILGTVGQTY
ncbi:MAG TPA: serine/threonine-protein kinase, partial [Gemmataceae bacterium]|nr:serine/threonine-protein kinase [Gemmataceae bacterium]